jgi:hypothetical protein
VIDEAWTGAIVAWLAVRIFEMPGMAQAPVLGDAAYGDSFAFRQRLRELNL